MTIELPKLPFALDGLAPVLSKEQVDLHYHKHHKAYVKNLNKLIKDTDFEGKKLEDIVVKAGSGSIFNNAAQVLNHNNYWLSLCPKKESEFDANSKLGKAVTKDFGTFDKLKEAGEEKAKKFFGSGWLFLVQENGKLEWKTMRDAHNPLSKGIKKTILTIDLWEHAWYVSFPAERAEYMKKVWDIINWKHAEEIM